MRCNRLSRELGIIIIIVFFYCCRVGVIFFIVMNQIFGNLSAVDLFVAQKSLFMYVKKLIYYRPI